MIRLWKALHQGQKKTETDVEIAIRTKFEAFLTVLAENEHGLALMTELEKKLFEKQLISIPYLKSMIKNLSKSVFTAIENLQRLSDGKYDKLYDVYNEIELKIRRILTGSEIPIYTPLIISMDKIHREHIDKVGSKMANLGELKNNCHVRVPDGFGITACAYTYFIEYNELKRKITRILSTLDINKSELLLQAEKEIKTLIKGAEIPPEIEDAIIKASRDLEEKHGHPIKWAVRSSAIGEDRENSFAGQFSSIMNVPTSELLEKYKEVVASKYNSRNILYQHMKSIRPEDVNLSIGVIEMVRPTCSGVLYTTEPMHPNSNEMIVSSIWGLGQLLVEGIIPADMFVLKKEPGFPIIQEEIAQKEMRLICKEDGGVKYEILSEEDSHKPSLTKEQLIELAETAVKIEKHFKAPQDIEWCFDENGRLFILQTRPLHTLERIQRKKLSHPISAEIISKEGKAVTSGVGAGPVYKVTNIHETVSFPQGGIMVLKNSSPRFIGALSKASAVVVEKGSRTDHMASVVRELNVPCLVKVPGIYSKLKNGQEITVDATETIIYKGKVQELLDAEYTLVGNPTTDVTETESYKLLSKMADYIFPLHLTDPRITTFVPEACKTWHDILRFCHETSLNEMFQIGTKSEIKKLKNIYRVLTDLPFKLYVFDLFGDAVKAAPGTKEVHPKDIHSLPFQELWKGMVSSDATWSGHERGIGAKDLLSAMVRSSSIQIEPEKTRSFAVVSKDYLNLSLGLGYHYVTLDCYIADDPYNNYITMSFKGGAAEREKRHLRVLFIAQILQPLGFDVILEQDFLKARIKAEEKKEMSRLLNVMGRLLGVTRLLDTVLEDEEMVKGCVVKFNSRQPILG